MDELRRAVPDSAYGLYLDRLEAVALVDRSLVVRAPAEVEAWVRERFGRVLQTCAAAVLGPDVAVDVVGPGRRVEPESDGHEQRGSTELNPKYTFGQFVIGDGNRFAHAASLAVAELPGQAYNPLFLYGPPGVGKTHLLHSIGNYVRAFGAGATVRYATVEQFTNGFLRALNARRLDGFKTTYRDADVLLLDDVQFLRSKARTEEEFFHTFNAVYESGRQLVVTCDRLPRDLDALEDRLRERFESGLVADIAPPDHATRVAILRKRVVHDGVHLSDEETLDAIASRVTDNVRALEGALIRAVAYASLTRRQLTPALADEVLDRLDARPRASRRDVRSIQDAICEAFSLSREELLSGDRHQRVAWPRQVAMYLARELTDESLPSIGTAFDRNHATVLHAWRRVGAEISTNSDATRIVRRLTEQLGDNPSGRNG